MEHFLASQVDITYVLSLYTSIILPKTTIVHDSDKLDIFGDPLHLSRGSSMSDDMEPSSASNMSELDDNAELESKKMSHNMLMALIKFLHKKRHSIIEKATAEGTEEVVFDAVGNNFESYNRFKKINKVNTEFFFLFLFHVSRVVLVQLMFLFIFNMQRQMLLG